MTMRAIVFTAIMAASTAVPVRLPLKRVTTARRELRKNNTVAINNDGALGASPSSAIIKNFQDAQYYIDVQVSLPLTSSLRPTLVR